MESDCLSIANFSSRQLGFVNVHKNLQVVCKWCKHDSSHSRAHERRSKWKTVKTAIESIHRPYNFQDGRQFSQAIFTKVKQIWSYKGLGSRLALIHGHRNRALRSLDFCFDIFGDGCDWNWPTLFTNLFTLFSSHILVSPTGVLSCTCFFFFSSQVKKVVTTNI